MFEGDRQSVPPAHPHRCLLAHAWPRALAPKQSFLRDAQFDTIRISLLKVAARISEFQFRTRIRIALPTAYPYQASWRLLAERAAARPP